MPLWLAALLGFAIVARVTRFLNQDYLAADFRSWVMRRFGDDKVYYLVTCSWCASIWVALPVVLYVVLVPLDGIFGTLLLVGGLWCGYSYLYGRLSASDD